VVALAIAAVAVVHFAAGVKLRLSTGMTGFDSTWYHGPFAAKFFQSGDTWSLHFIAPQFLAWFYPANSEVLHAVGMLAFSRDILSPLLNLGWFVGCLVAAWCIGRPYRVAPWSLALVAIALSVPALHDQAGEARNDIVGIFFLLAAVAIALAQPERGSTRRVGTAFGLGQVVVVGLGAGMAAGTKLNFLLPAAVLVAGIALAAPRGRRWRTLGVGGLAALAGGGYWYLRNLAHSGNPLPWVKHLGPITLPAPAQALGGREDHGVLGYLTNGSVWSDWFLPGLHHGLTIFWPLLVVAPVVGLLLCLGRRSDPMLRVVATAGLAAGLAWLIAPTSASGPDGMPHGFESGLRYLAPALVLGLSLLPTAPQLHGRLASLPLSSWLWVSTESERRSQRKGLGVSLAVGIVIVVVALGYPVQRHYLRGRYSNPSFTTPGLNAAFAWAQGISDARIATTSTRQYPLYGRDLSNEVTYIGTEQPHGGFTAPPTCPQWRRLLNAGHYTYVVTTRDRIEPGKPTYPSTSRWTKAPGAKVVLQKPPTVVYKLRTPLSPSACPR
jgi:Na+-transporting NADH:ubiquinone oxidoreductase subunit NqrE